MTSIYKQIGQKIRELRGTLSQEILAEKMDVASNTISRWETGTYKPTPEDLEKLARHFKVPITVFFPNLENGNNKIMALTSATGGLDDGDLEEVIKYAEFCKVRKAMKGTKRTRAKR